MNYDHEKVDEATLALLFLTMWQEYSYHRAWKSFDWDTLDRLHQKGWIENPKGKAKSVLMTEEGANKSKELFWKLFGLPE